MPRTWVRVLASVRIFICSVAAYLLCCPCEELEGPISKGFCIKNVTPLPSLYVDFYSRHVNSVLFFIHCCPLLIPLHNTAALIKICRFLINVVKFLCAKQLRNWTFQRFARAAQQKERNGTNEKSDTRFQVLVMSSADALPAKLRVPVGGTECFVLISFQILNLLRCLPFMWTVILDMFLIVFYSLFIIVHC